MKSLFSFLRLPCWNGCDNPRFHLSCFRCPDRRSLKGKLKNMYWNKTLQMWIPTENYKLCEVWFNQFEKPFLEQVTYVLFVDKRRWLASEKDIVLKKLWRLALKNNYAERAWLLKRIVALCENLAS